MINISLFVFIELVINSGEFVIIFVVVMLLRIIYGLEREKVEILFLIVKLLRIINFWLFFILFFIIKLLWCIF